MRSGLGMDGARDVGPDTADATDDGTALMQLASTCTPTPRKTQPVALRTPSACMHPLDTVKLTYTFRDLELSTCHKSIMF